MVQNKHKLKFSDTLNAEKSRSLVGINCYSLQRRAQTFCEENFLLKGNISFGDRYKILQKKDAEIFSSSYVSKHLKGRLGPPVSDVTFFNRRRSVGAPRE